MKFDKSKDTSTEIKTIDLEELAKVLWLQKKLIAIVMGICLLLAGVIIVLKAPIYQPMALIQVNNQSANSSGLSSLFSGATSLGLSGESQQASQAQIEMSLIQSNYILEPTVQQLNLDVRIQPKYFPLIGSYIARHYQGNGIASAKMGLTSYVWGGESWSLGYFLVPVTDDQEKFKVIVEDDQTYRLFDPQGNYILTGKIGVPAQSQDGMIQILWNSLSARPGTVFYLTKLSLVATLQGLSKSLQISELAPTTGGAGGMIDTGIVQLGLKDSQPAVAVAILNTIVELTLADNLHQKQLPNIKTLAFIKKELPAVKMRLQAAEMRLHAQEAKTGVINLQGQAAALLQALAQLETQIAAVGVTQAQYAQTYTSANPVMQGINAQVAALQQQKEQLQQQIATLPMRDQEGLDLMQDVEVQKQIYMTLLTSEQQYELVNASTTGDVCILDLATVPDQPLPQYRFLILLASLFAGFILGCLIVLIRHQLKNVINDAYWAEKEFGIRTVAVLPFSQNQATAKKAYDENKTSAIGVLAAEHPEDTCVEALRSLRTSLFFALKEKQAKVVNITGVIPATGKSFVSLNLAVILAQTGKRVLLIDADMRRGYLHRYFRISHAPGLSEFLSGVVPLEKIVHTTSVNNLSFIATGIYPHNPSELLLQDDFKNMLKVLEEAFDVVLIDSPPVLAVNDASIIAKEVPINYLVIPGGQLKPQELEAAVRRFLNDGVSLSGSIFNFAKEGVEKLSGHSYHSEYTKHYQKSEYQQ